MRDGPETVDSPLADMPGPQSLARGILGKQRYLNAAWAIYVPDGACVRRGLASRARRGLAFLPSPPFTPLTNGRRAVADHAGIDMLGRFTHQLAKPRFWVAVILRCKRSPLAMTGRKRGLSL
jgi:hypothetical protein